MQEVKNYRIQSSSFWYVSQYYCMAVNNHWTGLLEWTTGMGLLHGLIFFALKIIFMPSNEIH